MLTGKGTVEYSYAVASDGKTSSNIEKYINRFYEGNSETASVYEGYSYTYDRQNKISSEKGINSDGTVFDKYSYEYDSLGQLVRYNSAVENKSYTYAYDSNGNILTKTEYAYTTGALGEAGNTTSYGYDTAWKDKLTSVNGSAIAYDNLGNPTSYLGKTFVWEGRNLVSYEDDSYAISYEYDENGMRYRQTVTDKENDIQIVYDYLWVDGKLVAMTLTDSFGVWDYKYLYNSADELSGFLVTGTDNYLEENYSISYYYTKNAQGDITGVVNSTGEKIVSYNYDAFGKRSVVSVSEAPEIFTEGFFINPAYLLHLYTMSQVLSAPFAYRGYCYDQYTGLYYLQSRYYDPEIGRFINADDTTYLNATGTVLGCNLFVYCENDPMNSVDPRGEYSKSKAATYAQKWWNSYNPSYKANRGGDCANFVSQCLYAGNLCKMTGTGSSGWHHYVLYRVPNYNQWGSLIGYTPLVWQISDAWGIAPKLYRFLTGTKKFSYKKITTVSALYSVINSKTYSISDVAFFANGSSIYHAVLLGKTVNNKGKKNIYYFAHTSNRNGYDTSTKYGLKEVIYSGQNIYCKD